MNGEKDKVCDICGVTGFAECILTCSLCKQTSKHVYCMQRLIRTIPEAWCCDECTESPHEDVIVQRTNRKIVEDSSSDADKTRTPLKREFALNCGSSEQTIVNEKKLTGTKKPLCAQGGLSMLPDIGKEKRISVTSSPSGARNSFKTVERGKVKFIPTEEAARLPSEARSRVYDTRRRLHASMTSEASTRPYDTQGSRHASMNKTTKKNIMPPPMSRRSNACVSTIGGSKSFEVQSHPKKRSIDAEKHHSPSWCLMAAKHATNDKEEKILENEALGKEASAELHINEAMQGSIYELICNFDVSDMNTNDGDMATKALEEAFAAPIMEEPMEGYLNGEVYESPLKHIRPMESKCGVDGTLQDMSGHEPFLKPYEECSSKEETRKECVTEKPLDGSHDNIAVGLLPSNCSGINQPLTLFMNSDANYSSRPVPEICWKGTFDVSVTNFHDCFEVQAHFSCQVSYKVYEISKEMYANLKFNVMPRLLVWPKIFRLDPPIHQDVGLYFLPSEHERSKENYMRHLEYIDSHDFALQSCMGDVELLIYSSKQLPTDSERLGKDMYLWGVFRKVKRKNFSHKIPAVATRSNISDLSNDFLEGNSVEVDTLTDRDNMKIDGPRPVSKHKAPPGFSKPIYRDVAQGKRHRFTSALEETSPILNVPLGCSRLSASKSGNVSSSTRVTKVHQVSDHQSYAPNPTTPVIPDVPPGFSSPSASKCGNSSSDSSVTTVHKVGDHPDKFYAPNSRSTRLVDRKITTEVKEETESSKGTSRVKTSKIVPYMLVIKEEQS